MDLSKLPATIFGLHDTGGEHVFQAAGKRGWIVVSVSLSAGDSNGDFGALAAAGHGVIVRLNYGYDPLGTIPAPGQVDAFAQMCAAFVANSRGANIWIIGNETNTVIERPTAGGQKQPITPELYAQCFAKCRTAIKNLPGHGGDWLMPAPPGPWNADTKYTSNDSGDWVQYFQDNLLECAKLGAAPDALALHTYTHGIGLDLISAPSVMNFTPTRCFDFRVYRDFLAVVPPAFRSLPVFITESQAFLWEDETPGWIAAAYAEIDAWNRDLSHQPIQALCLFRWQNSGPSGWVISIRSALVDDFGAVLARDYRVRWPESHTPPLTTPDPAGWCPFAVKRPITNANYDQGRSGQAVRAVVLHVAAGFLRGVFPTFNNPAGLTSSHFAIGKDGAIEQYVSIRDTAYGNGLHWTGSGWQTPTKLPVSPSWPDIRPGVNPNLYTISIEHEGFPADPWSAQMYDANNRLLQWIAAQCNLSYLPHHSLVGHNEIDPVDRPNCPGPNADFERIAVDANGGIDAAAMAAYTAAQAQALIAINTGGALYKFAQRSGMGCPRTAEFLFAAGANSFVGQVFEQKVVYAKSGDWGNIKSLENPPAAGATEAEAAAALAASQQLTPLSPLHDRAMFQFGQRAGLGCPVTDEWSFSVNNQVYAGQTFAGAIAYLKVGDSQVRYVPKVFMAATGAALQRPWLPINADSALYKFAVRNRLGYPQTAEFEFTAGAIGYVGQLYQAALAYVAKGDWSNVKTAQKTGGQLMSTDSVASAAMGAARLLSWLSINPDSVLYKYAQLANLGYPQCDEFVFVDGGTTYVGQVYALAMVYQARGDGAAIRQLLKPVRS